MEEIHVAATQGGTTHMARETAEQPDAVARTLETLLPRRQELVELLRCTDGSPRSVMFAARGTSDNAAVFGRYLLETQAGIPVSLAAPSVVTHYGETTPPMDLSRVLLVSISQSGATEEIVQTQRRGAVQGAATLAMSNVAGSPLLREADLGLQLGAGEEIAVPATKSYTAQLAALAILGLAACEVTGQSRNAEALEQELSRAPQAMSSVLASLTGAEAPAGPALRAAVELLAGAPFIAASSRGLMLGSALESGLKIEETCLRPVRSYSYADMRHGPVAALGEGAVVLLSAASDGPMLPAMRELAADLQQRGLRIIGIGGDPAFAAECEIHLPGGDLAEPLAPLTGILAVQVLAERLSRHLGHDPDSPEGLNKITLSDH